MADGKRQTADGKESEADGCKPLAVSSLLRGIDRLETESELQAKLEESRQTGKPLRVKLGIDASGPDIHLGFAVPLRMLRRFQDAGHVAVLIIGDFTGSIGDPSGRSKTRPQLTDEQIQANMERYKEQVFQILLPDRCEFRYNSEWSKPMNGTDIIKLAAKYTVARLIEREDFKKRLAAGDPIHVHELLYPLFQGYDSVAVRADIELGGADQYWNLLVGRELQREFGQEPQVVITMPLLVGLDGTQKMSKSYGNYVAITEAPREMFGKLMSIPDSLIVNYLELCTDKPAPEIAAVKQQLASGANPRDIKAELAKDVIAIYHSRAAADEAAAEFDRIFRDKQVPDDMPEFKIPAAGVNIIDLVVTAGLLPSKTEARRKLIEGAFHLGSERITDAALLVKVAQPTVLKVGKRRFLRLVPADN
jgi:tyrosyl-tRNA synthetase